MSWKFAATRKKREPLAKPRHSVILLPSQAAIQNAAEYAVFDNMDTGLLVTSTARGTGRRCLRIDQFWTSDT